MYRSKRGPGIGRIILLGLLAGIAFFVYDSFFRDSGETPPTDNAPVVGAPTANATAVAVDGPVGEATPFVVPTATLAPGAVDIGEATLLIPRTGDLANIVQVYLDGTSWDVSNLGMNVGHLQGTAWVEGSRGNVVLSGHVELSDGRRGIFAGLEDLTLGEMVILTRNGVDHFYRVVEIDTVAPDDLTPLYPTLDERLTLITCSDYDIWSDSYEQRQVVVAELVTRQ